MKVKIEKRLSYLYTGESFSVISFMILSFILNKVFTHLHLYSLYSFWISFFLLELLLVQGTMYWYAKWKRLKIENTAITPTHIVHRLKRIKKWNIGLMLITPLLFVIDFYKWYPSLPVKGLSIAGFIYIFSILEYINYFHIQLSYDNLSDIKYLIKPKRLKKACLSKDFQRLG
ncbi:general stress protein [Bacillus sp. 03113]|uniref:general stress protein n=1 Tax=Bacillus sp. 03113 TaxID=2578211 RepID=UPI001141EC8D|nr:general stress protein [Bacillus sp. 03113]